MTKKEKQEIINATATGYYSGFGGIEIKEIRYGIDDYVVFVAGAWCSARSAHIAKIYYTDRPYFLWKGVRIHLDEIIRA